MRYCTTGLVLALIQSCATGSTMDDREGAPSSMQSGGAGAAAFANPVGPARPAAGADPALEPHGCNDLRVEFKPVIPTVLLVVDRSGSMFDSAYGGSPTRWLALTEALFPSAGGVLSDYQGAVRFGLLTYTSDSGAGICPILRDVAPALGNLAAIKALYQEESARPNFKAETPTGAAVAAATEQLQAIAADGPGHILLVTDGEPDDCVTADPQCGQDLSIAAVQSAYAQGIGTSVVGISADVSAQHLQDLANAGQGMPVQAPDMQYIYNCVNPGYATLGAQYAAVGEAAGNAPIYQPADAAGLATAIGTLIRGVTSCDFELDGEVDLERAELGRVMLDGQRLIHDDANGWRMQSSRVLQLQGTACDRVQTESEALAISFPCDVVEVL